MLGRYYPVSQEVGIPVVCQYQLVLEGDGLAESHYCEEIYIVNWLLVQLFFWEPVSGGFYAVAEGVHGGRRYGGCCCLCLCSCLFL